MSYKSYEEFEDRMTDILSSGMGIEFTSFHKGEVKELISGMDRDEVVKDLNRYYNEDVDLEELLEGELETMASLINATTETRIIFK